MAEFEIKGLRAYQKWLAALDRKEVRDTKDRILRKSGLQLQANVERHTPVRHGLLRGSMSMGHPQSVFDIQVGQRSYVFVGTAVEYAQYVNDGYQQKAGQFVPGYWSGKEFVYVPNYQDGGMVLTGKLIPGAHMFEKGMRDTEDDIPDIIDFEFRRLYELLFRSGGG